LIRETNAIITHEELPTVHGDPTQLMQLFQNLISNAIKFRGQERPMVEIRAVKEDGEWIITVADNGRGIAPEHFNRLFKMFARLPSSGKIAGTGLGLAICQRIAERHRGRIWVESEMTKGSRFIFALPATS
jgi:signal transduction histidine kinase